MNRFLLLLLLLPPPPPFMPVALIVREDEDEDDDDDDDDDDDEDGDGGQEALSAMNTREAPQPISMERKKNLSLSLSLSLSSSLPRNRPCVLRFAFCVLRFPAGWEEPLPRNPNSLPPRIATVGSPPLSLPPPSDPLLQMLFLFSHRESRKKRHQTMKTNG
jgi:hypothetical protein